MDTKIFRDLSYGVYITTTLDGQRPTGCITNSVMQITSSPATLAVSVNHDNFTNGCIAKTGKFAVSILPENTDPVLIGAFGFQSGKDKDKFAGVDYELAEGIPVVKASMGYMVCKVISTMETSTHTVFLGEVIAAEVYERTAPAMTYAYYHAVLKGKSPKNAPTYQPPGILRRFCLSGVRVRLRGGRSPHRLHLPGLRREQGEFQTPQTPLEIYVPGLRLRL